MKNRSEDNSDMQHTQIEMGSGSEDEDERLEDDDSLVVASRAYQIEMYEESRKRNIIVAMDTGTGKTRVAILRIRDELERSPPPQIVWFLAPKVLLCNQQCRAIVASIPWAQTKVITSQSDVDKWSTQEVWDEALCNVRIVVATHQVLLDAMHHGFVKLQSISLLVFDEVHECAKGNPGKRIMDEFYGPARERGERVPAILGMTASPVQGKKLDGLEKLERTMHAVCRTPTLHRAELVAHTKQPMTFRHACYNVGGLNSRFVATNMLQLQVFCEQKNRETHTEVSVIKGSIVDDEECREAWAFMNRFCRRAGRICEELGPWAADYFVYKVLRRCAKTAKQNRLLANDRRAYLRSLLCKVVAGHPGRPGRSKAASELFLSSLSNKVKKLVEILLLGSSKLQRPMGMVFVKERAMTAVLARMLSLHPQLRQHFQTSHVVGTGKPFSDAYSEALALNPRDSSLALERFRQRQINLLVTTSVLEEGIDVPACNLVVCIDPLTSLKEFIQRRGRAREDGSQLHLLLSDESDKRGVLMGEWEELEQQMKKRYADRLRAEDHLYEQRAPGQGIDNEELLPPLCAPATQAQLRARDAKMHLEHFCVTSTSKRKRERFINQKPVYILHEHAHGDVQGDGSGSDDGLGDRDYGYDDTYDDLQFLPARGPLRATVQLPITVAVHLRRADSRYAWRREEDAYADAAFQAYTQLYEAGLLTDNLLPPKPDRALKDALLDLAIEGRPGVVAVQPCWRPWPAVSRDWAEIDSACSHGQPVWVNRHALRLVDNTGSELCHADLVLPRAWTLPPLAQPIDMYWQPVSRRPWRMHVGPRRQEFKVLAPDHTTALLSAAYGHRWPVAHFRDHFVRIECVDEPRLGLDQLGALAFSLDLFAGKELPLSPHTSGLVRKPNGTPYVYEGIAETKPPLQMLRKVQKGFDEEPEDVAYALLGPIPKQPGALHYRGPPKGVKIPPSAPGSSRRFHTAIQAASCRVDTLPTAYVQFGALVPPLTPVLEVHLVAAELLSTTDLRQLSVKDRSLFATAISAPAAQLPTNYEYLEFVGDSILKVLAVTSCAAQHIHTPEGHLSLLKDRLVANSRLCRAALDFGLDRFIVSQQWSLRKWRKMGEKLQAGEAEAPAEETNETAESSAAPEKQKDGLEMSTKMLADVVEALIGASMLDGGLEVARKCITILLPDKEPWLSLEASREILFAAALPEAPWPVPAVLEEMIGYRFQRPALLAEAMTHASTPSLEAGNCMERLEFMGDALLDHVIIQEARAYEQRQGLQPMDYQTMHMLRSSLSNANFLGFLAMELSATEPASDVRVNRSTQAADVQWHEVPRPLWIFMKHGVSAEMSARQAAAVARHAALREPIQEALWTAEQYPWTLLARMRPEKMFSDLIEALVAAVWVDSGSLAAIAAMLDHIGLLPLMRRVLDDGVRLQHPKTELGCSTGSATIEYKVRGGLVADMDRQQGGSADTDTANSDVSLDSDDKMEGDQAQVKESAKLYACRLLVDGECVVEVLDAWSREEAECYAAEIFVREMLPSWKLKAKD